MSVISLTITESSIQIISGIPKNITLEANIPCTIFYTLDDSTPTVNSSIYLSPIQLPTDKGRVVLKIYATNGTDSSEVIENIYETDVTHIRKFHSQVSRSGSVLSDGRALEGVGSSNTPPFSYTNPSTLGVVDLASDTTNIPDGYNGMGGYSNYLDRPLNDFTLLYSETNEIGERGHGIGTLPGNVIVRPATGDPESSNVSDKLFNPRAMVIYQNYDDPPFDETVAVLNRGQFTMEKLPTNDANNMTHLQGDSYSGTGTFMNAHYNPRDNTTTYYYFDPMTLRWIISKEPNRGTDATANYSIVYKDRKADGRQFVYPWVPFKGRVLP